MNTDESQIQVHDLVQDKKNIASEFIRSYPILSVFNFGFYFKANLA